MESTLVKDKGGIGSWILILGCPLKEKHCLSDPSKNISGPGFADCAHCEYQVGMNYQVLGADGNYDGAEVSPEQLKCGKGNQ
jgi:hypothetical protein